MLTFFLYYCVKEGKDVFKIQERNFPDDCFAFFNINTACISRMPKQEAIWLIYLDNYKRV